MRFAIPPDLLVKLQACRERQGWSDEVTAAEDAFLLDGGLGPPGYLTADGRVLVDGREWDGSPLSVASEDEAHQFLVVGARKTGIEELLALIPAAPPDSLKCPRCHGTRWAAFGRGRGLVCWTCHGRGWVLPPTIRDAFAGCLLGTAFGDGLGLPFEGLSPARRRALFGLALEFRLLPGRAMGSDDTEHTCHVARALLRSGGDVEGFRRALANSLRGWFLCLPAGIGKATAIGCLKLLVGFPADRAGAFSAGNGPAMRSAVLGLMFGHNPELLREHVRASTRLTHTDPLAERGALLVALAAGSRSDARATLTTLASEVAGDPHWEPAIAAVAASLHRRDTTPAFAAQQGWERGVSGFILHTVPVALHAALGNASVPEAIRAAVECGGDSDTTGAIAGAIAGARLGTATIPPDWPAAWIDRPITLAYLERLADELAALAEGNPAAAPPFPWWQVPPRNLAFLAIVLAHGARRLLAPWGL